MEPTDKDLIPLPTFLNLKLGSYESYEPLRKNRFILRFYPERPGDQPFLIHKIRNITPVLSSLPDIPRPDPKLLQDDVTKIHWMNTHRTIGPKNEITKIHWMIGPKNELRVKETEHLILKPIEQILELTYHRAIGQPDLIDIIDGRKGAEIVFLDPQNRVVDNISLLFLQAHALVPDLDHADSSPVERKIILMR